MLDYPCLRSDHDQFFDFRHPVREGKERTLVKSAENPEIAGDDRSFWAK
jgi:hypothetical protein